MTNRRQLKRKTRKKKVYPKIGKKVVRSDFEFQLYKQIKQLLPRGAVVEYEPEKLTYTIEKEYTPDFVITFADDTKLYIEAKGNGRAFDHHVRQKMTAIKEQHPDKDIRISFYRDGQIGKTMRQSDWANKYGYVFSIGNVPKEWLQND